LKIIPAPIRVPAIFFAPEIVRFLNFVILAGTFICQNEPEVACSAAFDCHNGVSPQNHQPHNFQPQVP